jgi:ABC-type polysaccharide/polyol phosphate export permease
MSAFSEGQGRRSAALMNALAGIWAGAGAALIAVIDDILILQAIILRNLKTKYRKNPFGMISEFVRPAAVCTVHYFYFSLTTRAVPCNQYLIFTLGGFTIWFCFSSAYLGTYQGAGRSGGATNIPGVSTMHLCLSRALWAFLVYFVFAMVVAYPLRQWRQEINPPDILISMETYGMAAGLGFGYGLLALAIVEVFPAIGPFIKMFRWAVFITSGVYESLTTMSKVMAPYIQYNPLIHLAEYERFAFYPGYPVYLVNLTYPFCWMLGLIFVGLVSNRWLANNARSMAISL